MEWSSCLRGRGSGLHERALSPPPALTHKGCGTPGLQVTECIQHPARSLSSSHHHRQRDRQLRRGAMGSNRVHFNPLLSWTLTEAGTQERLMDCIRKTTSRISPRGDLAGERKNVNHHACRPGQRAAKKPVALAQPGGATSENGDPRVILPQ